MVRESEMCHSSDPEGRAHADCELRKGHDGLCQAFGQAWNPNAVQQTFAPAPVDRHLLAAATLLASEDECVLLGPWRTIEEPWGRLYGIDRGAPYPRTQHWFETAEDARSVCAALNRNERVRQLGENR